MIVQFYIEIYRDFNVSPVLKKIHEPKNCHNKFSKVSRIELKLIEK